LVTEGTGHGRDGDENIVSPLGHDDREVVVVVHAPGQVQAACLERHGDGSVGWGDPSLSLPLVSQDPSMCKIPTEASVPHHSEHPVTALEQGLHEICRPESSCRGASPAESAVPVGGRGSSIVGAITTTAAASTAAASSPVTVNPEVTDSDMTCTVSTGAAAIRLRVRYVVCRAGAFFASRWDCKWHVE
jgi:hypothetical protein